jgi:hypothetical protein
MVESKVGNPLEVPDTPDFRGIKKTFYLGMLLLIRFLKVFCKSYITRSECKFGSFARQAQEFASLLG